MNKLILIFFVFIFSKNINSQEVRVINNKGTITSVNNNTVTSGAEPTLPLESDIWFDTANSLIKVRDGVGNWLNLSSASSHTGTTGSVFFAGPTGDPSENNNQFLWNNTTNRLYVGFPLIGTNKLNVNGTIRTTGLNNANGTENLPSYRFFNDSNTGMFRPGADQLAFSTGGNNALTIDNTQNVNINKNLSVLGSYIDSNGNTGTNGQVLSSTVTGTEWIDNSSSSPTIITKEIGYIFSAGLIRGSDNNNLYNINSTITRTSGNGYYNVTFTNAHPNGADYTVTYGSENNNIAIAQTELNSRTANGFRVFVRNRNNNRVNATWSFNVASTMDVVTSITSGASGNTTPKGTIDTGTTNVFQFNNFRDRWAAGSTASNNFIISAGNYSNPPTSYEILLSNVPYSSFTGLSSNVTVTTSANADGTYNHLFTSVSPTSGAFSITASNVSPGQGTSFGGTINPPSTIAFYI